MSNIYCFQLLKYEEFLFYIIAKLINFVLFVGEMKQYHFGLWKVGVNIFDWL